MINDIFRVFGEQTAEILFEIITGGLIKKVCRSGLTAVVSCSLISRERQSIWSGV